MYITTLGIIYYNGYVYDLYIQLLYIATCSCMATVLVIDGMHGGLVRENTHSS